MKKLFREFIDLTRAIRVYAAHRLPSGIQISDNYLHIKDTQALAFVSCLENIAYKETNLNDLLILNSDSISIDDNDNLLLTNLISSKVIKDALNLDRGSLSSSIINDLYHLLEKNNDAPFVMIEAYPLDPSNSELESYRSSSFEASENISFALCELNGNFDLNDLDAIRENTRPNLYLVDPQSRQIRDQQAPRAEPN